MRISSCFVSFNPLKPPYQIMRKWGRKSTFPTTPDIFGPNFFSPLMKSAQNLRIVREEPRNAKSGVFLLKSDFRGVGYPQNHPMAVRFWKIFIKFPSNHPARQLISVFFAAKQHPSAPGNVSTPFRNIFRQFPGMTALCNPICKFWIIPYTGEWKYALLNCQETSLNWFEIIS